MAKLAKTNKHVQIDKSQSTMMAIIIAASVVTIFCLVSSKALLSHAAYQRKVVNANHAAVKQLQSNVTAANQLVQQYTKVFEGASPQNIIGGQNDTSPTAQPPNGDNARVVLDALPSTYDFPALLSSVSKILAGDSIANQQVSGTDDSASINNSSTTSPTPQPIQLNISGTGTYISVQAFITDLERSIRPFDVTSVQLSGPQNQLNFSITVTTYFQPAKSLTYTTKEIK